MTRVHLAEPLGDGFHTYRFPAESIGELAFSSVNLESGRFDAKGDIPCNLAQTVAASLEIHQECDLAFLAELGPLTQLAVLPDCDPDSVSGDWFSPQLRRVVLRLQMDVRVAAILGALPKLQTVALETSSSSSEWVAMFASSPVTKFYVTAGQRPTRGFDDDCVMKLASVAPQLNALLIAGPSMTDASFVSLASFKSLDQLFLTGAEELVGAELGRLECVPIRGLSLRQMPLDTDNVIRLPIFPLLQTLDLSDTPVDSRILSPLEAFPSLVHLRADRTAIPESDVAEFNRRLADRPRDFEDTPRGRFWDGTT